MEEQNTYTITGGPLKPHEHVVIKREMNAADDAWITNHSSALGGTKKKPEVIMTVGDIKLASLKRMIVSWQLTRTVQTPDGSEREIEIALSEQAIENLPRRISAYINKKIDELNPDDEDDEVFTNAASGSSVSSSNQTKTRQPKG